MKTCKIIGYKHICIDKSLLPILSHPVPKLFPFRKGTSSLDVLIWHPGSSGSTECKCSFFKKFLPFVVKTIIWTWISVVISWTANRCKLSHSFSTVNSEANNGYLGITFEINVGVQFAYKYNNCRVTSIYCMKKMAKQRTEVIVIQKGPCITQ